MFPFPVICKTFSYLFEIVRILARIPGITTNAAYKGGDLRQAGLPSVVFSFHDARFLQLQLLMQAAFLHLKTASCETKSEIEKPSLDFPPLLVSSKLD